MRKLIELSVKDLQTVAIQCASCHTRVLLDLARFEPVGGRTSFVPSKCPACGTQFDTALQNIDKFRQAWNALSQLDENAVLFHVSGEVIDRRSA